MNTSALILRPVRFLYLFALLVTAFGLGPVAAAHAAQPAPRELRVVATIQPARGLIEPILKESGIGYRLETLIPVGVSEHGYEIPPQKLAELARADIVVMVGLGLEPQVEKFLADRKRASRKIVVLADAAGIKVTAHDHTHECGAGCKHVADPHVWLDPVLVEKMVSAIAQAIRDAAGGDAARQRQIWLAEEAMLARVKAMHDRYTQTLETARVRTLIVGHDAWGYLAERYNLETVAIKGLLAQEPTPASIDMAIKTVREHNLEYVFIEPQLSKAAGERIAQTTSIQVSQLDPLGSGDWFAMMDQNLRNIAKGTGARLAGEVAATELPSSSR